MYRDDSPVTNGLVAWLDAGVFASYPGSGTIMNNLTGDTSISGVISNAPVFTSSGGGGLVLSASAAQKIQVSVGTNKIRAADCTIFYAVNPSYNVPAVGQNANISYRGAGMGSLYMGTNPAYGGSIFTYYDSATPAGLYGPGTVLQNQVTVCCVVVSQSSPGTGSISHYTNGVFAGSSAKTGLISTSASAPLYLGYDNGGTNEYFTGTFHSWLHYNRVLSNDEIMQNFRCFQRRFGYLNTTGTIVAYNSGNLVTNGLVLHLDAGNTSSYPGTGATWFDLSGQANHAALSGSPTFVSGALQFGGAGQYGTIQDAASLNIVKPTIIVVADVATGTPVARGAYGVLWNYGITGITTTSFKIRNNNGDYVSDTIPAKPGPSFFAGVHDGVQRLYFRDGATAGSSSTGYSPQIGTAFTTIGAVIQGASFVENFAGKIYFVLIYNRDLSASEILQNFNAIRSRFNL